MFEYVPDCLLVNVRTIEVQPEGTSNISSAHEAMRAVNGFALAVPENCGVYRIFPPDIWRNRYYTYILLEPMAGTLVVALGNYPTHPTRMFPIDFKKEIEASWREGPEHLLQVCSAVRHYHLLNMADKMLAEADKRCREVVPLN